MNEEGPWRGGEHFWKGTHKSGPEREERTVHHLPSPLKLILQRVLEEEEEES